LEKTSASGPDADLEVLAPEPLGEERGLDRHRLGRTRADVPQAVADRAAHARADRLGLRRIARGAFLDHALDHGPREGHAAGLHRLEIAGGEDVQDLRIARGRGEQPLDRAEIPALRRPHVSGRILHLADVPHERRLARGDVDDAAGADGHDQRTRCGRIPDTSDQGLRHVLSFPPQCHRCGLSLFRRARPRPPAPASDDCATGPARTGTVLFGRFAGKGNR
jgi:hypothetical protein